MKNKKLIGKIEYNKALKIVMEYEKQKISVLKTDTCFGFLWFDKNDKHYQRIVIAKDIYSACDKFLLNIPKTLVKIDYEVSNMYGFIDISDMKNFEKYL